MPHRLTSRLAKSWLVPLCLVAGLLAVPSSAGAITSAQCDNRANSTPEKLLPCIQQSDLWNHMKAFQQIANENPGLDGHPSRNSGEPGYLASVNYVAEKMRAAGYSTEVQTYTIPYTSFVGTPTWSQTTPTPRSFTLVSDWNPGPSNGDASGPIQPAGGIVIPSPGGTHSGCDPSDFTSFVAGRIALIQRGTCTFSQKIQNAQNAGASGVIIFNEGNTPERSGVFSGSLSSVPPIPVAFTSFAIGKSLYDQYQANQAPDSSLSVHVFSDERPDYNLIAESKYGDPNHVVVIDAHLDAIYGAGMLDNASGSATILNLAEKMRRVHPRNKLRFIWFGGEEIGLLGSDYYVHNLSSTELSHISYDLDADVTATPNYLIGVLDPAGPDLFSRMVSTTFPPNVYEPSQIARDLGVDYLNSIDKNHIFLSPVGTDAFWFNMIGVPASGVLTGQDCCKPQSDVDLFGGKTGNYEGNLAPPNDFDGGCVDNPFRWCDNLNNNDPEVMTFMSRTFDNMAIQMANRDFTASSATLKSRARTRTRLRAASQNRLAAPRGKPAR
jgi:Peptidase family M28/PA domain